MKVKLPPPEIAADVKLAAEEELDRRLRGDGTGHLSATTRDLAVSRAHLAYLIDPERKPSEAFYYLVSDHMGIDNFRQLAVEKRWKEGRDNLYARAKRSLARSVQRRIVQDRFKELEQIEQLRADLFETVTPNIVEGEDGSPEKQWKVAPKSLEGVIRSFRDIHLLVELMRKDLGAELERIAPEPDAVDISATQPFTGSEIGEIARGLLATRSGIDEDFEVDDEEDA